MFNPQVTLAFAFICLSAFCGVCPDADAETLKSALASAYSSNPAILSERAKLRSIDEQLPEALSGWRPTASAQGDAGLSHEVYDSTSGNLKPADASVTVAEPLFRGGKTTAETHQADAAVNAERAQLTATEQTVLVNAATAYLDLLQDQTICTLQAANKQTLDGWVAEAQERFRLGEKSRTDISLFQSRLARATADLRTATINLGVARSTYLRFIGKPAGALSPPDLTLMPPADHDALLEQAAKVAPEVMAAYYDAEGQAANVKLVRGDLLPEVSLQGSAAQTWNENVPQQFINQNHTANDQLVVQLKVPLYTGGGDYARLRAAYQQSNEKQLDLDEARREAIERAEQAWQQYEAEQQIIAVRQDEVSAAQAALTGMKSEERLGDRSSFDTLDAEQDLLNAQIGAAQAEHDRLLALIQLTAVTGHFTAADLHLDTALYDPVIHYRNTRNRWFGWNAGRDAQ